MHIFFTYIHAYIHTYTHLPTHTHIHDTGTGKQAQNPEFIVPQCNPYLRLVLMQTISKHFPDLVIRLRNAREDKEIVCMRSEDYEDTERIQEANDQADRKLRDQIGFRHLFKMLGASDKCAVVHNGMFDIMFLIAHFGEHLGEDLETFQEQV